MHDSLEATEEGEVILNATGVEVVLGGAQILRGVDLTVRRGEVHVLIGPNGAGKTTFANAVTGHVPISAGSITLRGQELRGSVPKRARQGIGRKFQVPRVFERLTVGENLIIAETRSRATGLATGSEIDVGDASQEASVLAHGVRQRLEMKMVLSRDPEIAVLDEPTAGMTRSERTELGGIVRRHSGSQSFLIVEHDMDFVEQVADRVSFMYDGEVIATGTFAEIAANRIVRESYLGGVEVHEPRADRVPREGAKGALEVEGLTVRRGSLEVVRNVSFTLPAGRALGVLGRNGAGKTSLLLGLMGLLVTSGKISLDKTAIDAQPAWRRAINGIALVPQGRQLFADLSVRENLELARMATNGGGNEYDVHSLFPILTRLEDRRAGLLSGGEQQQVAIARALLRRPNLMILDEPTEGLAPSIIEEISGVLRYLSDEGLTIILAEQHRSVVERICDDFLVLRGGEVAGSGKVDSTAIDAHYLAL